MSPFTAWILSAMLTFVPPDPRNVPQLKAYVRIAVAIERATSDPYEAALLASIGSFESGFRPSARGTLHEIGVFQLLPPPKGAPVPSGINAQASEALRRVHLQGMCGYTGEAANPKSRCPLAKHRIDRAKAWIDGHPFTVDSTTLANR